MGYFGLTLVARHTTRLDELADVADIDSFADYAESVYATGWRLGRLRTGECPDPARIARELVEATGAPAIAMYICDSDYADGACNSPNGHRGQFYLDEQAFLASCADFEDDDFAGLQLHRNHAAVGILVAWAKEAGFTPDAGALAAALAEGPGPGLNGVYQFVLALGVVGATA
jgi:hypothetical protein